MYQIKATNGYEIQVIGKGEKGLCRVQDQRYNIVFSGTYAKCEAWLNARGCKTLGMTAAK